MGVVQFGYMEIFPRPQGRQCSGRPLVLTLYFPWPYCCPVLATAFFRLALAIHSASRSALSRSDFWVFSFQFPSTVHTQSNPSTSIFSSTHSGLLLFSICIDAKHSSLFLIAIMKYLKLGIKKKRGLIWSQFCKPSAQDWATSSV